MKKAQKKGKKSFNMYEYMHKNKKIIVTVISILLALSMLLGTFVQLASSF